ncbi:Integrase, catalytic core [Senna tora]|uniref:Integrase, catalytic core n=1 Tax=Senna tora TaxID=362788 RepID=A0A835CJZ3_9FABA|nr:Integrase, catalytic core [Senna tora]
MRGNSGNEEASTSASVNAAYFANFAVTFSITNNSYNQFLDSRWIIDSGASSYVIGNLILFSDLRKTNGKNTVQLPDGAVKTDPTNKEVVAIGDTKNNLYFLNRNSDVGLSRIEKV